MNRSVFSRIIMVGLLPFAVIVVMIAVTNMTVRRQITENADRMAQDFAHETAKQINNERANVSGLLKIVNESIMLIDPSAPGAADTVSNISKTMLAATPYVYCIWFSFDEGEFFPDKRFSMDFIKSADGEIIELEDWDEKNLGDPGAAPWYYYPYTTGKSYYINADYYDYGSGNRYTDTISSPLVRGGKTVGVVGIDTFYEETFKFIDEKQIENERFVIVLTQNGEIVYSAGGKYTAQSIFSLPFGQADKDYIQAALSENKSVQNMRVMSPFLGVETNVYFNPVYTASNAAQLYLYVEFNTSVLYGAAARATLAIIITGVVGLIIQTFLLVSTIRNILHPIKRLTASANMIADGNLDIDLYLELTAIEDNKQSNDEIYMLFSALKQMLNQLNRSRELELENVRIQSEKEKAEASARSKGDFLAKMSHEIRTPMNAIIGMTELALREDISDFAREHILTIKQAGANLLYIINDILDFSKIEEGKLKIIPADYLFSSLINDVISIIRMRVIDSPVRFVVNLDGNIPNALIGDEIKIRQVLLNLLNNAVKYTEEGFVSLNVTGKITEDESTVLLTIEVVDSGKGIKQEDMGKLFGNFVQIDLDHNKGIEGTGLGLVIAKNIVSAMDGNISVQSEYGKGSTFTVVLPQKVHSLTKIASVKNPEEKGVLIYQQNKLYANSIAYAVDNLGVSWELAVSDLQFYERMASRKFSFVFVMSEWLESAEKISLLLESKAKIVLLTEFGEMPSNRNMSSLAMPVHAMSVANILNGVTDNFNYAESGERIVRFTAPSVKVLVADDIKTNLKVTQGLLLPYKVQTTLCKSGREAIEAVKTTRYDLVLMDHMMPEIDGIEAAWHIRALGGCDEESYYRKLPIVALTANAVAGVREMFLENGFNEFLTKPIDTVQLNSVMEKLIPKEKQKPLTEAEAASATNSEGVKNIEIDGIDVNKGVMMTGGTVKNYLETLSVFYGDGFEKIEEIKKSLQNDDLTSYVIYVHALKSASASIGASELSEAAKALEMAGKHEDYKFIQANTDKMLKELEELLHNIGGAISSGGGEATNNFSIDAEELKAELIKLRSALDDFDLSAIDGIVNSLHKFTHNTGIGAVIKNILQNILTGGYEEAVSLIDDLINNKI